MTKEVDEKDICPFCDENSELRPRAVRVVKSQGDGGKHVTIRSDLADVGDRVLVINVEDKISEDIIREKEEEEKDPEEVVQEICIRCNYKWEGKRKDKPINCPCCGFAYWDRPDGFTPPTYKGISFSVDEDKIHTDEDKRDS